MPAPDLDSSWALALGYAFNHGWQFGKDIVFTLGPYGFLYGKRFDPDNYSLCLALWLIFAAVFALGVSRLLEGLRSLVRLLVVAALLIALRSSSVWGDLFFADPFLLLIPLIFAFVSFHDNGPRTSWPAAALLALSALAGLVKFTCLPFGFGCMVLVDLHRVRRRLLPWYTAGFSVATLGLFMMAGQSPFNFTAYLRGSLAVASGYSEAMQVFGSPFELMGFVLIASSFLLVVLRVERRGRDSERDPWLGSIAFLVVLAFTFIVFKAAFVRHDVHAVIGWCSMAAAIVLYVPRLRALGGGRAERIALVCLSVVVLGVAVARHCQLDHEPIGRFLNRNFAVGLIDRLDAVRQFSLGRQTSQLTQRYQASMATIRAFDPLPRTAGTVDAMPWDAAGLLAAGSQYRPRPVFQSFAVFNSSLIELNRSFLRSENAPSEIVFDVATIDDRLPALDDGALWPELIARYDAQPPGRGPALLIRRALPRRAQLTRIAPDLSAGWGTPVAIPPQAPLVWVMIDVQKNLLGRIVDFLFKLPVIDLSITFEDGSRTRRRLVPGIARNGFLLSPVVDSANGFVRLLNRDASLLTALRRVSRIEIDGPINIAWFYGDSIRVGFQELSFDTPP